MMVEGGGGGDEEGEKFVDSEQKYKAITCGIAASAAVTAAVVAAVIAEASTEATTEATAIDAIAAVAVTMGRERRS
jgi:hypothetical protein